WGAALVMTSNWSQLRLPTLQSLWASQRKSRWVIGRETNWGIGPGASIAIGTRWPAAFRQVIFATPLSRIWTPDANASSVKITWRLLKFAGLRRLVSSCIATGERNDKGFNRFSKSRSV